MSKYLFEGFEPPGPPPPPLPGYGPVLYEYINTDTLKGKFSSEIEGPTASTLNHNFNWKQLSEMIVCIFLLMFSKFI